jgi:hypothetical protein
VLARVKLAVMKLALMKLALVNRAAPGFGQRPSAPRG